MRLFYISILICFSFNLIAQPKLLQHSGMQGDLHILYDSWVSLHPGIYRFNTPQQLKGYFTFLQSKCSHPLSETAFYISLSQLAQKVKCGHTYLNPLNLDSSTSNRLLPKKLIPIFFRVINQEQWVITQTLNKHQKLHKGDAIMKINGISVRRIMDSLLTVSRSDGYHSLGKKYNNMNETPDEANSYSLFDIYFPKFFRAKDTWLITVKEYKGKHIHQYNLPSLSLKGRMKAYENFYGPIPTEEKSWGFGYLNLNTAYMKFGTFAFWNSKFNEKKYIDSIFNDLYLHPQIKNLIIDIRGNEGGDNSGDYILSYITDKKLGCDNPDHRCYRFLTIPDTLLPYLSTWDNSFKSPKKAQNYFKNELGLYEQKSQVQNCDYIEPQIKGFRGKVILLIDAKNSSAGFQMAQNIKVNKLGSILGETTGGSQQGINGGEFLFLKLPNSHFEIDLPLIFNYHPNKPDQGIIPDFQVQTSQKDIFLGKDSQLNFALSLIKKRNK